MGRGIKLPNDGLPMPVVPTENKGIMSGPIRKPRGRRRRPRGSRPDVQLGRVRQPDGSTLITYGSRPPRRSIGRRMLPPKETFKGPYPDDPVVRPLTGGYNPDRGDTNIYTFNNKLNAATSGTQILNSNTNVIRDADGYLRESTRSQIVSEGRSV